MFVSRYKTFSVAACVIGLSCVAVADNVQVDAASATCLPGAKDGGGPVYCTIQAGVDAAHAGGGGDVRVAPGVYRENIQLYDEVNIRGNAPGVIIEFPGGALPPALLVTANECLIRDVTLRIPAGANAPIPLILISAVEDVRIENCTLDGGFNRGSVGVYVQNQLQDTSRMYLSELRDLEVGVLAEDTLFRITRCLFDSILRDGINARPPSSGAPVISKEEIEAPEVGDENDLELSGFNRFRNIGGFTDDLGHVINEGDSFFLRNNTGFNLTAQINDWGVYESASIGDRISDQLPGAKSVHNKATTTIVYEPFIGKSIFPGSVFVRIRDAVSLTALTNANPRLRLNLIDTEIEPAFDTVSSLYSFTFINPNTYTVLAQAPAHDSASRTAIVGAGEIVALDVPINPVVASVPNSIDTNGNHKIELTELLRAVQFYNTGGLHCQAGTEDGYAPGPGPQDCAPHNSDYAPQDWMLNLSEVLRVIQFYNSGGYHACSGTEDGFCPGA